MFVRLVIGHMHDSLQGIRWTVGVEHSPRRNNPTVTVGPSAPLPVKALRGCV